MEIPDLMHKSLGKNLIIDPHIEHFYEIKKQLHELAMGFNEWGDQKVALLSEYLKFIKSDIPPYNPKYLNIIDSLDPIFIAIRDRFNIEDITRIAFNQKYISMLEFFYPYQESIQDIYNYLKVEKDNERNALIQLCLQKKEKPEWITFIFQHLQDLVNEVNMTLPKSIKKTEISIKETDVEDKQKETHFRKNQKGTL